MGFSVRNVRSGSNIDPSWLIADQEGVPDQVDQKNLTPQFLDDFKINADAVAVVIGESDVAESALARAVDPRLQKRCRVRLKAMSLRMGVVIGEESHTHILARRARWSRPT